MSRLIGKFGTKTLPSIVFLRILGGIWILAAIGGFISSSYFGRATFPELLSFPASDTPPVPGSIFSGPLGVHSFGDFLQPYWQARLYPSPYLTGYSSYLPFANGLFWLAAHLPYWFAFFLVQVVALSLLGSAIWSALPADSLKSTRIRMLMWGVFLSAPVLVSLDRGNIQLLTFALMALGCASTIREKDRLGAFLIGIACALKGYPLLLFVIWIRRDQIRNLMTAMTTAGILSLVPLLLFKGGLSKNLHAMFLHASSSQGELETLYPAYNNSLRGLLRSVDLLGGSSMMNEHAVLIGKAFVLLLLVVMLLSSWRTVNCLYQTLAATASMVLVVDFSPAYVLGVLFSALTFLFAEVPLDHFDKTLRRIIAVTLALVLTPKQIPFDVVSNFSAGVPTLASVLNPILLLGLLGLSVVGAIHQLTSSIRQDEPVFGLTSHELGP